MPLFINRDVREITCPQTFSEFLSDLGIEGFEKKDAPTIDSYLATNNRKHIVYVVHESEKVYLFTDQQPVIKDDIFTLCPS